MAAGSNVSIGEILFRLPAGSKCVSPAARFLETRLAALRICFESLSSIKIGCNFVMLALAISSGLYQDQGITRPSDSSWKIPCQCGLLQLFDFGHRHCKRHFGIIRKEAQ